MGYFYGVTNVIRRWYFYNGNVNDDNRSENHTMLMSGANLAVDKFINSMNLCNVNFESRYFSFTPSDNYNFNIVNIFQVLLRLRYNGALLIFTASVDVPYEV